MTSDQGTVAPNAASDPTAVMSTKETSGRRAWARRGPLDPRRNSLNLLRLVLAAAVLVHHAYPLGGYEGHPSLGGVQYGGWAVFGFFAISGYLITASRSGRDLGSYLVHRIARIFPAFWVCLAVVAFVFAPIAFRISSGSLDGFLTTGPVTPIDYVLRNLTLRIGSYEVGTTIVTNPYPGAWNGSLWTLYYEFLCYLLIGAAYSLVWWRRHRWPTAAAFVATVSMLAFWPQIASYLGANVDVANMLQVAPFFIAGSLVYRYRDLLGLHWIGAIVSVVAITVALQISTVWGLQAAAPFLTYLVLWLGSVVPSPKWTRRNDISYGVYIYAFPVQQLLVVVGLNRGLGSYLLLTAVITTALAALSWFLLEQPVMNRVRRSGRRPMPQTGAPAST